MNRFYLSKRKNILKKKHNPLEIKLKLWDLTLKSLIPIIAIGVGLWQFFSQQQQNERLNFEREMWLKKYEMYSSLNNSIAKFIVAIEYSEDSTLVKYKNFKINYWTTTLVEDSIVVDGLVRFKDSVDQFFYYKNDESLDEEIVSFYKKKMLEEGFNLLGKTKLSLLTEKEYLK